MKVNRKIQKKFRQRKEKQLPFAKNRLRKE
jgi:hypothetical protein